MKLTLSGNFLGSSTYSGEDGRVVYKVKTTLKNTTVSKILPDDVPQRDGVDGDRFAHLARINWGLKPTIEIGGNESEAKTFLRRVGWAKDRVFTDENGREYKWDLGTRSSKLNDETKTLVAKFRQKNIGGIFGEKRPASMEIFSVGESMVDLIMVTFLFVEKTRRDM
ncbi:hypothetical protein V5O48_014058 [Marasmius crinis-equi]|uniref:DUF6593 domain-containing protein n=1 Tax=Marasmius crinis-equi TaxID=585013 RepID=A0ABR3EYC3_9AGAR